MATKATLEAIEILRDCIEGLQSEKGTVLSGIQKLKRAATILDENDVVIWCEIQLGNGTYTRLLNNYIKRLNELTLNETEENEKLFVESEEKLKEIGLKESIHYTFDEIVKKSSSAGGGYENIGFIETKYKELIRRKEGNDGKHYTSNLLSTINYIKSIAHKYATQLYNKYQFADTPQTVIDILKSEVDDKLLDLNPELAEKLMLAFKAVTSNNPEELSQALTTCRRFIEALADELYPATDEVINNRKLGKANYINRLWAFMDKSIESDSNKEMAKAHVDYLGSWLQKTHKLTNKGVHAEVDRLEAVKVVLHIYLMVGDILKYLNVDINNQSSAKVINIHTATLDELQSFLDINKSQAKDIVKLRVNNGKLTPKDLLKIKGIGKKTIEKAEDIFSFKIE